MDKQRRVLRRFIMELEGIKGRHTELVSVYVPVGFELFKVVGQLQEEQGTAKNIKDAKTRGNVIDSLEKIVRHLKLIQRTPQHGLAVFAGNVAAQEGKVDIKLWSIEPPEELKIRLYRCDQTFVLDPLREMIAEQSIYGLIAIDRRDATIGYLRGTQTVVVEHITSGVPGKFKAGGQSAARFSRLIEGMAIEFYKRVSELCNKEFLGKKEVKGLIVGGPGPTKEEFIEYLNNEIKKKILVVQDITYVDESGLQHLVEKSRDVLSKEAIAEELAVVERFFATLGKDPKRIVYGEEQTRNALQQGAVELLVLSDALEEKKTLEFEELAEQYGADVRFISTETAEGRRFRDFSGIGAILRYPIS